MIAVPESYGYGFGGTKGQPPPVSGNLDHFLPATGRAGKEHRRERDDARRPRAVSRLALQPVRFCFHLLNSPKGANVSLEHLDDVAVHYADGSLMLEQTTSALKSIRSATGRKISGRRSLPGSMRYREVRFFQDPNSGSTSRRHIGDTAIHELSV